MWTFSEVIDGMKEACEMFETPVVSGNVSFYNETDGRGILPTPVIGMVGLIEDTRKIVTHGFKSEGDIIAVLGLTKDDLAAGEYAQIILGLSTAEIIANGIVPRVDLEMEKRIQDTCLRLIDECLIRSAHDCSDGGLAVTIAESCFASLGRDAIGAEIALSEKELSAASLLFGETPSRIVISFAPENEARIKELADGCPLTELGRVTGETLNVAINGEAVISTSIADLESAWRDALRDRLEN